MSPLVARGGLVRRAARVFILVQLCAVVNLTAAAATDSVSRQGSGAHDPVTLHANDNVERAIVWTQAFTGEAAITTVLLGRDDHFSDALASGGPQGILNAPLLLTAPDVLDPRTLDELQRLGATEVILLGGQNALSAHIQQELSDRGYRVQRLFGSSRIETAIDIAETVAPAANTAILARAFGSAGDPSQGFADALAGGALGASLGVPLLLTDTERLSNATTEYLDGSNVQTVLVLGGPAAVSEDVIDTLNALGIDTQRLAGTTRTETAIAVANTLGYRNSADADVLALIDAHHPDAWADAFAAARFAAIVHAPLLLAPGSALPESVQAFIVASPITVYCGTTAQIQACEQAAAISAGNAPPAPGPVEPVTSDTIRSAVLPDDVCGPGSPPPGTPRPYQMVDGRLPGIPPGEGEIFLDEAPPIAYGDVNGDGVTDAVAAISCNYGGTAAWNQVHAFTNATAHLADVDLGSSILDRSTYARTIAVVDGSVELTYWAHHTDEANCCPSRSVTDRVSYNNGIFEVVERRVVDRDSLADFLVDAANRGDRAAVESVMTNPRGVDLMMQGAPWSREEACYMTSQQGTHFCTLRDSVDGLYSLQLTLIDFNTWTSPGIV